MAKKSSVNKEEMVHLHITLPAEVVKKLDAHVARLAALDQWPKPSRMDLIRTIVSKHVRELSA